MDTHLLRGDFQGYFESCLRNGIDPQYGAQGEPLEENDLDAYRTPVLSPLEISLDESPRSTMGKNLKYGINSKIGQTLKNPSSRARLVGYMRDIHGDIQLDNIYAQRGMKERFLEYCGYTHLVGKGGVKIPLRDCPDEQIGEAAREEYRPLHPLLKDEIEYRKAG